MKQAGDLLRGSLHGRDIIVCAPPSQNVCVPSSRSQHAGDCESNVLCIKQPFYRVYHPE